MNISNQSTLVLMDPILYTIGLKATFENMNFNLWSVLVAKKVHIGKLLKYPSASEFVCFSYFHGQSNSKIRVSVFCSVSNKFRPIKLTCRNSTDDGGTP